MARHTLDRLQEFTPQSGSNEKTAYFSLKNDKDTAVVRFMYNTSEDIEFSLVHQVEVGEGKKIWVNCLRQENYDPLDTCPLCKAGNRRETKFFIPLYDESDGKIKIWQRGASFGTKLSGLMARVERNGQSIVGQPIEIERNGRAGDMKTTYEMYSDLARDNKTLDDLPELPSHIGGVDKSADDMVTYLETHEFPRYNNDNTSYQEREETPRQEVQPTTNYPRRTPTRRSGRVDPTQDF